MIQAITLIATPIVISGLTWLVKKVDSINLSENRVSQLRFVVAFLSFLGMVGNAKLNGSHIDLATIQPYADSFVLFLASSAVYFFAKKSPAPVQG